MNLGNIHVCAVLCVLSAMPGNAEGGSLFSQQEVESIRSYWKSPGRYTVGLPTGWETRGIWQVRLTVDGSKWLHTVARNGTNKKPIPGQTQTPETPERAVWEQWIQLKLSYDRWVAADIAFQLNQPVVPGAKPNKDECPPEPGPMPEGLRQLAGECPKLASAVVPMRHSIHWEKNDVLDMHDHAEVSHRYAFYRFDEGVMLAGKALKSYNERELSDLYRQAEITDFERRVLVAVSGLEGGFEAINTYDTGFVSVGFIQFASLRDGAGSLGKLLQNYKRWSPQDYERDFKNLGVDVSPEGKLIALDLDTLTPKMGSDANAVIIQDKRLIAAFHRSGSKSKSFRVAQLRTAKEEYYPGLRPVTFAINGQQLTFQVSDIIKSEAGMATLMDRLVNTGNLDPLPMVLLTTAVTYNLKTIEDLAKYEHAIVTAMKYRKDYMKDKDLSKPTPPPSPQE